MKKTNSTLLIFIFLIISGCTTDSQTEQTKDSTIFGKWKLTSKLVGSNKVELGDCEKGEGVVFLESLVANFIIEDRVGIEPNIEQEGFEDCDFRYATYDFVLGDNNELLYAIVAGEGEQRDIDDSITTFEIEVLTAQELRIKLYAHSSKGTIEDVETNSEEYAENEKVTFIYKRE